MNKRKSGSIVGGLITIILLIILVILSNLQPESYKGIGNIASALVMPIQNGLTYLKNKLAGNDEFFTDINNLKTENEELKQKNSELEKSLRELEIIKAENATLKEYMNMVEKYTEFSTIPAYIISRDISNYSSNFTINVGTKDGIGKNMTVIADAGLVGHIIEVTENTAKVQTIIDAASAVSATISTSRDGILLRGGIDSNKDLKATYIPAETSLVQGDNVETSGMGGIYEKGIHIGKIKEIVNTKNITNRYAIIETAVDFKKIETVLVIKKGE